MTQRQTDRILLCVVTQTKARTHKFWQCCHTVMAEAVRAVKARVAVEREAAAKVEEVRAAEAMEAEERAEAERAEGAWRWPVDEDLIRKED